jgi:hypothetical protein
MLIVPEIISVTTIVVATIKPRKELPALVAPGEKYVSAGDMNRRRITTA